MATAPATSSAAAGGVPTFRIVVLGDGGVGKSALSVQLCQNRFVADYNPTIEDSFRKQTRVGDQITMLDILDTAGQEYAALREQYFNKGNGFLLVYSVTSQATFNSIANFRAQVLRVQQDPDYPMVIVGNKCDLEEQRKVSTQEGRDLAKSFHCPFFETSAKTKVNVEAAFEEVAKLIQAYKPKANKGKYVQEDANYFTRKCPCTLM